LRAAGRALQRLDPEAARRWRRLAESPEEKTRLKAARLAEGLAEAPEVVAGLERLAGDRDSRVRSCAVAVLGRVAADRPGTGAVLRQALDDTDPRVRANAVEALERCGPSPGAVAVVFARLTATRYQRERANAIKALLHWRVRAAGKAIRRMLADSRPAHRRSARWVVREFLGASRVLGVGSPVVQARGAESGGVLHTRRGRWGLAESFDRDVERVHSREEVPADGVLVGS